MDDQTFIESNALLLRLADTCNPDHQLFKERAAIQSTIGAELTIMRLSQAYDPLTACKLCFGLGAYLGLQHNKLNKILEKQP